MFLPKDLNNYNLGFHGNYTGWWPTFRLDGSEQKRPNAEDCCGCCMRVGGKDFDISEYSGSCDLNPKKLDSEAERASWKTHMDLGLGPARRPEAIKCKWLLPKKKKKKKKSMQFHTSLSTVHFNHWEVNGVDYQKTPLLLSRSKAKVMSSVKHF